MKLPIQKATWKTVGGILASAAIVVSFQNCGKAGFDSDLDSGLTSASIDAALNEKYGPTTAAKVSAIPFAFDGGFDQITYNSCAESAVASDSSFFTLKAGAYAAMGIKLSAAYFNYVDANFSPIAGNAGISKEQYAQFLADSPANKDARAAFSIRSRSNLNKVYTKSSNSVQMGTDIQLLASNLTSALIMDAFTDKSTGYVSYFPFSPESMNLDSSYTFNSSESDAAGLRNALASDGLLTFGYSASETAQDSLRAPASADTLKTAYGRGYMLGFTKPGQAAWSMNPKRILGSVQEKDLYSGAIVNWNCAANMRLIVMRTQDHAGCPIHTFAELQDANRRSKLEVIRHHLRADQWDVNVDYMCAVPKGTSCYNENDSVIKSVEYSATKECFDPTVAANYYTNGVKATQWCPHYVSICTRY